MEDRKERWESMKMTYVGNIRDVVQGGGGKTVIATGDPGDSLKPPGQE